MTTNIDENSVDTPAVNTDELSNVFDYIVHPGDDLKDIINNQASAGDTVWLGKGEHTVTNDNNSQILLLDKALTIDGPEGATVKLGDGEIDDANKANVIKITADDVVLTGHWTLDWNKTNNGGNFVNLQDVEAIKVTGAVQDVRMENFTIKNADTVPIDIEGTDASNRADNIRIENVDMFDVGKGPVWNDADHVKCIGNYIDTVTASAATENGIEASNNTDYWVIRDNTVTDCDHSGVYVKDSEATKGRIIDNDLVRCGAAKSASGIIIGVTSASENILCRGNLIVDAGDAGINYEGADNKAVISENIIITPASSGILLGDAAIVEENIVDLDEGYGIVARGGAPITRIINNKIDGPGTGAGTSGIQLQADNCLAADNNIKNFSNGVWVTEGADSRVRDNDYTSVNTKVDDIATRTRINGMGSESVDAETPTAANWDVGDVVDFTDSGDGSGTGVYKLLKDGTWSQIGS